MEQVIDFSSYLDHPRNGTAVALHCRVAPAGASAALGTLVTTPTIPGAAGQPRYPRSVLLQNETASGNSIFVSLDGTAASATNGIEIAKGASKFFVIPTLIANVRNGANSTTNPQLCIYSAGANVQVLWVF